MKCGRSVAALSSTGVVALLTACSGPGFAVPGTMPHGSSAARDAGPAYKALYSFRGTPDGTNPAASLIDVNGVLYGTTTCGGTYDQGTCAASGGAGGTAFSLTKSGKEKILHSFGGGSDGSQPHAPLVEVNGTLYGTTQNGGAYACHKFGCGGGTVFSMTTDGAEKVLHSFGNGTDGSFPMAGLIGAGGKLYGTTSVGGTYGDGTVFRLTKSGKEKVLHWFGEEADGQIPVAGLVDVGGTLYGTTEFGGSYICVGSVACGTVFSITAGGSEKVLHSFGQGTDGNDPVAGLIDVSGTLYGTTSAGGVYGSGTVFSVMTGGSEKVLHSFGKGTDGNDPVAGLIDVSGKLYGTTYFGGINTCGSGITCGTVFSVTTVGTEKLLHSFGSGKDGVRPLAGMVYEGGRLVGTTYFGGSHGDGIVFSLTP